MEAVIVLVYTVWAVYSGYKFLTGRYEWLDRKEPVNRIVKGVLSVLVGYVIAVFYLIYVILRFLGIMEKHF